MYPNYILCLFNVASYCEEHKAMRCLESFTLCCFIPHNIIVPRSRVCFPEDGLGLLFGKPLTPVFTSLCNDRCSLIIPTGDTQNTCYSDLQERIGFNLNGKIPTTVGRSGVLKKII